MEILPIPVAAVDVPDSFAVTSVANSGGCSLRLLAAGTEWESMRLPAGPEAAIGSMLHSFFERWSNGDGPEEAAQLFKDELAATKVMLAADETTKHFADLQNTKTPLEWMMLELNAVNRCSASMRGISKKAGNVSGYRRRYGAEIWLESSALKLKGKADEVIDLGPQLKIRDYKSGSIHDANGSVKPSIFLQLRLYGLLAVENYPGKEVQLEIDNGKNQTSLPWDQGWATRTESEWRDIRKPLEGPTANGATIANPGACCQHCPIRHRCAAYLRVAPIWWNSPQTRDGRIPLDTWGVVKSVVHQQGRATITLADDAGRQVRITDLETQGRNFQPGGRAYFFGLEKSGRSAGWGTMTAHPQDFHELPPDRSARRAWSMQCYAREPS
jgi:hypothetical protein